jgi:hypothetical protein
MRPIANSCRWNSAAPIQPLECESQDQRVEGNLVQAIEDIPCRSRIKRRDRAYLRRSGVFLSPRMDIIGAISAAWTAVTRHKDYRLSSAPLVAAQVQDARLIAYRRGHVHIRDLEGLKSCERHERVKAQHERLFGRSAVALDYRLAARSS